MTTQNAMMERRGSEELSRLKLENTVLLDHNRRFGEQNGALIEEVEKLRLQLHDWKERLDYARKALRELAGAVIVRSEGDRSKMVMAEREACAVMIDNLSKAVGEYVNSQTDARTLREIEVKMALLRDTAAMIRARKP